MHGVYMRLRRGCDLRPLGSTSRSCIYHGTSALWSLAMVPTLGPKVTKEFKTCKPTLSNESLLRFCDVSCEVLGGGNRAVSSMRVYMNIYIYMYIYIYLSL